MHTLSFLFYFNDPPELPALRAGVNAEATISFSVMTRTDIEEKKGLWNWYHMYPSVTTTFTSRSSIVNHF